MTNVTKKVTPIKNFKNSSFITIVLLLFILVSYMGYRVIKENIISDYDKDTKILFYKIQNETTPLLSKLLYQYSMQKEILLDKHELVKRYLQNSKVTPLDVNLESIHKKINNKNEETLYNIYVSDKNLVIRNSTFKKDIGFDLSFAKESFDEHFEENITGICTPLFEQYSKQFISYTDSYIGEETKEKNYLLQVSYTYKNNSLEGIKNTLSNYPSIIVAKAYIMVDSGFVNGFSLKETPSHKLNIDEMLVRIMDGKKVNDKLYDKRLIVESFEKNSIQYTSISLSTKSPIFDDTKIIYSIVLDDTQLQNSLQSLNVLMIIVILVGFIAVFITFKLRIKEIKLSEQDRFVQSSMHEIKTPLSIITLNNELRELEFGRDEYSLEIDSAIKTLKTSYEDMSFTITKEKLSYPLELITLSVLLKERVEYFKSIAYSNAKTLNLKIESVCDINISKVELIRVIDNNLSNAIKYSSANSIITIVLSANKLSFHNEGEPIRNSKKIFDKYVRENSVVGGYGLGLSIVKDIADKYEIKVGLTSSKENGTTFSYIFKCHTSDAYALGVQMNVVE